MTQQTGGVEGTEAAVVDPNVYELSQAMAVSELA